MTTALLWLLIATPAGYSGSGVAMPSVVERFVDLTQCEEVAKRIRETSGDSRYFLRCIQARVVVRPEAR